MNEVAVIGWAQTRHGAGLVNETGRSIISRTADEALASCGLAVSDMDFVISAGDDFFGGAGISACLTVDAAGAHFTEEIRVAADGLLGAVYAAMRIAGGSSAAGLVVACGKSSDGPRAARSKLMAEPFYERPLGIGEVGAAALQARAYMHHYAVSEEACASVAVKNRAAGERNRYAALRTAVTLEQVLASEEAVSPIRELERAPATDGACAVVLADGQLARAVRPRCAWIAGTGHAMEPAGLGSREMHRAGAASRASRAAYRSAGIADPASTLDVVELTEEFAHQELMLCEALGLCDEGEAPLLVASGACGHGGRLPVNPSGGALCANPVPATGLVRLAEVAAHVTGRHDEPIAGAKAGLALSTGGLGMQSAACVVLER